MRKFLIVPLILACNAKGVECADSTQPCVSTQVNDDSHDLSFGDNTYDNDQSNESTTINNDTTIINNPVVTVSPNGGSGGDTSGTAGAGGNAYDAGVGGTSSDIPDSSTVTCDSPNAEPTDVRNWFSSEFGWFQLITFDGFSADRCTYTGKIKWFYQGPDGYWESDRVYDSPESIFTIGFTTAGLVKGEYHEPTVSYPNGYVVRQELSVRCYVGLSEGDPLRFDNTYRNYNCLTYGSGNHPRQTYVFRGEWVDTSPMLVQQVYPRNNG